MPRNELHFGSLLSKELGLHAPHMLSCFHAMMIEERWAPLLALIVAEDISIFCKYVSINPLAEQ